jgi:hypothetical protein
MVPANDESMRNSMMRFARHWASRIPEKIRSDFWTVASMR